MCPLEFLSGRSKTWALVSLIVKLEHENSSITWIFESDYKILNFDQRNESYFAALSYGAVFDTVQDGFTFWVWMHYPKALPFKRTELPSSTSLWHCLWNVINNAV